MTASSHPGRENAENISLSDHAVSRMFQRRLPLESVEIAKRCGRISHVRGARVYSIGRIEVEKLIRKGLDARQFEGVHVVCSPDDDKTIMTVYRNKDFRILKPKRRHAKMPRLVSACI